MSEEQDSVVVGDDWRVKAALEVLEESGGEFRDHGWRGAQGWIRTTMQEYGGVRLVTRFVYFEPTYDKKPYIDFIMTVTPGAQSESIMLMASKVAYLKTKAPLWA